MEIAEKVSVKTATRIAASASRTSLLIPAESVAVKRNNEQEGGFEIMANVVWCEIGKAVMNELGSVVFAAGKPDEFRKVGVALFLSETILINMRQHHETTQAFIHSLEFLAPSLHAVEAMRTHPIYISFERRWQLPVYFQLRWKETVTKLEESLVVSKLERTSIKGEFVFVARFENSTCSVLSRYATLCDGTSCGHVGGYCYLLERRRVYPRAEPSVLEVDPAGKYANCEPAIDS